MRKLSLSILLLITLTAAKAQQTDRVYYGLKGGATFAGNVFNSTQYPGNLYVGPMGGLFADFCLYKRLWVFAGIDVTYGFSLIKNNGYDKQADEEYRYNWGFTQLAVSYRISKDDKPWQLYPYLGISNIVSNMLYKYPLMGFETKREYGKKGSVALGANITMSEVSAGIFNVENMLGNANLYVKIGFGALKRKVE